MYTVKCLNDARNGSSERLRTLPRKEEEKELK